MTGLTNATVIRSLLHLQLLVRVNWEMILHRWTQDSRVIPNHNGYLISDIMWESNFIEDVNSTYQRVERTRRNNSEENKLSDNRRNLTSIELNYTDMKVYFETATGYRHTVRDSSITPNLLNNFGMETDVSILSS
jgi:hypothetical protein